MTKRFLVFAVLAAAVALPLAAQNQQQQPKISEAQRQAIMKVQTAANAQNWDGMLQAITDLLENFPDSPYKHRMMLAALQAAENENNYTQMVVWGDRVIQDDPNDFIARVQLAEAIAQHTRENDLDRDQSLKKVDDYAHQAISLLQNMSTPPADVPLQNASQWPDYKQKTLGQAYYALAIAAELQKNYPEAQTEFTKASQSDPTNAVYLARLAKADYENKQYDDAIAAADKAMGVADVPANVKQFAQQWKDRATAAKGASGASATPPAATTGPK